MHALFSKLLTHIWKYYVKICIIHALFMHYSCIIHELFMHYSCIIHAVWLKNALKYALFMKYSWIIHALFMTLRNNRNQLPFPYPANQPTATSHQPPATQPPSHPATSHQPPSHPCPLPPAAGHGGGSVFLTAKSHFSGGRRAGSGAGILLKAKNHYF